MAYVYKHIRLDTNEIFYIGIGLNSSNKRRVNSKRSRNNHWLSIVKKFGFKSEVIYDNITWEEACKIEIDLIKLYGRSDLGLGNLVNKSDGGEGNVNMIVSESTKQKLRDANIGKKGVYIMSEDMKTYISNKRKGIIFSEEHKRKLSKAKLGSQRSEETKSKISQNSNKKKLVLDTESGVFYESVKEAAKAYLINYSYLVSMLCGDARNKTKLIYV